MEKDALNVYLWKKGKAENSKTNREKKIQLYLGLFLLQLLLSINKNLILEVILLNIISHL